MPNYTVIKPSETFKNKTYVEWVQDWSSWFYQANPDQNNNGDVVFLRGMALSDKMYTGGGNVMIGNDSLEITENQAILIPVITANYVADNSETPEWLFGTVRSHISSGDDPPLKMQLIINGQPIEDEDTNDDLGKYEIETPVFMLNIPDASQGHSLKDNMEEPMQTPGYFPSVTRGYFVLLKLNKGEYIIESYATGATTAAGQYHASLLYHIVVRDTLEQRQVSVPPSKLRKDFIAKLQYKHTKGEIDKTEFEKLKELVNVSSRNLEKSILNATRKTAGG